MRPICFLLTIFILFCRANLFKVTQLMKLLNIYTLASGLEINLSKFEVFFSRNISRSAQEDIAKIMGVRLCLKCVHIWGYHR